VAAQVFPSISLFSSLTDTILQVSNTTTLLSRRAHFIAVHISPEMCVVMRTLPCR
jgi:hypothetical protein